MGFRVERTSVPGSTATLVFTAQAGDLEVQIKGTGTSSWDLGADASVSSGGYAIRPGNATDGLRTPVRPGDELWAYQGGSGGFTATALVHTDG